MTDYNGLYSISGFCRNGQPGGAGIKFAFPKLARIAPCTSLTQIHRGFHTTNGSTFRSDFAFPHISQSLLKRQLADMRWNLIFPPARRKLRLLRRS